MIKNIIIGILLVGFLGLAYRVFEDKNLIVKVKGYVETHESHVGNAENRAQEQKQKAVEAAAMAVIEERKLEKIMQALAICE